MISGANHYHSTQVYNTSSPYAYNQSTNFKGNVGIVQYIDLGRSILPLASKIAPRDNTPYPTLNFIAGAPGRFKIYGSDTISDYLNLTGSNWILLHNQSTNLSYSNGTLTEFNLNQVTSNKTPY